MNEYTHWTAVEPLVYQRPCIGQEHSASYHQNAADGHTELSLGLNFTINVSPEMLVKQAKRAWMNCRLLHPEIAVQLSTDFSIPQIMTYRVLLRDHDNGKEEEQEWLKETFVVEKGKGYESVIEMTYNRKLPTKGKQSMMYLVLDTDSSVPDNQRNHGIVWNVSHAVTDAFSIIGFLNTFLQQLVDIDASPPSVSSDGSSVVEHLPISPLYSYEQQYKPTKKEKEESLKQAKEQLLLVKEKMIDSIAMYPEPNSSHRHHQTHCFVTRFNVSQSNRILSSLKEAKLSITYAGAAATIMATRQLYARGHEKGALLGMTRNARRWVATVNSSTGRVAIPMATDVVFLWIPFDKIQSVKSQRQQLLLLSQEIQLQLAKHLADPHYLSSVPFMSDVVVEGLRDLPLLKERMDTAAPSSPGFSSQGLLPLKKDYTTNSSNSNGSMSDNVARLTRTGFTHTGRQVGPSPWIGMFTLDKEMNFSIGFDEKYYQPTHMNEFLQLVYENVALLASPHDDNPSTRGSSSNFISSRL